MIVKTISEPCKANGKLSQSGLTLIEMMIALVLSSIIFVSAYQVIHNLVEYQVKARIQHDRQFDRILFDNLMSQIVEKGINQYDLFYRNQKSTMFRGESDSLQLISRAYSERYDDPGHRIYRLFLRNGELLVSYRAFGPDLQSNPTRELATGLKLEDLRFAYLEGDQWVDRWTDENNIPGYVRIRADFGSRQISEWVRGTSRK